MVGMLSNFMTTLKIYHVLRIDSKIQGDLLTINGA